MPNKELYKRNQSSEKVKINKNIESIVDALLILKSDKYPPGYFTDPDLMPYPELQRPQKTFLQDQYLYSLQWLLDLRSEQLRSNHSILRNYLSPHGKILPRRITGLTSKQQKKVTKLIKRARIASILPFVIAKTAGRKEKRIGTRLRNAKDAKPRGILP